MCLISDPRSVSLIALCSNQQDSVWGPVEDTLHYNKITHTSIQYIHTVTHTHTLPTWRRKFATCIWWINSCPLKKCHNNNDPCVCVSFHYLISCKYSCVQSASCGLHVWKPYTQRDKLAACPTIINWNNIYRSAFRAVANGFWAYGGKYLCVCLRLRWSEI